MRRAIYSLALLIAAPFLFAQPLSAEEILKPFSFRELGPAVFGGRIVDLEVHPRDSNVIFVAAASGGLWKSINNGTTFTPIFENERTISIGDVAISQSNPDIIWIGTGENNMQRSALYGDGVYKTTDGGKTWQNMGLPDSIHIGRIVIDPKNPDIVYVASLGPLYRAGGDRGVYKTTNGGRTWELVLRGPNDTTGFVDMVMDPKNPRVLYAAACDHLRRAWHIRDGGPGSGIYKTTDAGRTWTKLAGGLPQGNLGRIGLAVYPQNPNILYATVINQAPNTGIEIYRTNDAGRSWKKVNEDRVPGSSYYGKIRIDPNNPDTIYVLGVRLARSDDGGVKYTNIDSRIHVDHHSLWIDPQNSNRILLGNDGGFYKSYDRGDTWWFVNNLPIGQFYAVGADMSVPYNVMGGTQDNGAWRGPSRTRLASGINNTHWIAISGGDGFYSIADPEDPNTVYTSSQFGNITRFNVVTQTSRSIRPREPGQRANWMTPFMISPHNPRTLYWGAQRVYRTTNRGDSWVAISPDLTTNDPVKIKGNVPHCTITKLDESPVRAGVLWVGTDDGNVWVTENGGVNWTQVNQNITGAPKGWWVSRVTASPHDAATAFVSFTGFREDIFEPHVYKTTDYGKTWTSIASNLPKEHVAVIKQDTISPDLLVIGTELGCYISLDGGGSWNKMSNGLPTTAVQDLLIHPRDGDLILGTHGRGIFVMDITPLRQLNAKAKEKPVHLFTPDPALAFSFISNMFDPFSGHKRWSASNPATGAAIYFWLREQSQSPVKVEILDIQGRVLREYTGRRDAGIQSVNWDLRPAGQGQQARPMVPAGSYLVRLTVGETVETSVLEVQDWIR
jgi:photosystem II stability/assembly factor-like uncharacterized protein